MSKERIDEMKKFIQLSEELEEAIHKGRKSGKQSIDLSGPDGNAFVLLGYATSLGRQLGYTSEQMAAIQSEMKSGDYENLLTVFDREFGDYVDLYRGQDDEDEDLEESPEGQIDRHIPRKPKKGTIYKYVMRANRSGAESEMYSVNKFDVGDVIKNGNRLETVVSRDIHKGNLREEDDELSEDFRGTTINPKHMAAQNKATKQRDREAMKTVTPRPPRETGPGDGAVGQMMMDAITNVVPDGDPMDWLLPKLAKVGIREHEAMFRLNRAARSMGYADYHDAVDSVMDMYNQQDTMAVEGFEKGSIKKKMNRYSWFFLGTNPKELIDHVRSASDKELVQLARAANEYADESSPRDLQMRLINQELKRRHGLTPKGNLREEDETNEEMFYVVIVDGSDRCVARLEKYGRSWHEECVFGDSPDGFGSKTYMSYLSPEDIISWLNRDYSTVLGPFADEYEAEMKMDQMAEEEDDESWMYESINLTKIVGAVLHEAGDLDFDFDDWNPGDDPATNLCPNCEGIGCDECEGVGEVFESDDGTGTTEEVMRQLRARAKGTNPNVSDDDWEGIEQDVARRLENGWSEADIINFLRNTEELNPDLDEETALRRMKVISDKYKTSMAEEEDEDEDHIVDVGDDEDFEDYSLPYNWNDDNSLEDEYKRGLRFD